MVEIIGQHFKFKIIFEIRARSKVKESTLSPELLAICYRLIANIGI